MNWDLKHNYVYVCGYSYSMIDDRINYKYNISII